MGLISDLFGMVNVQRIKNGGTARLSICQITGLIVNMSEAKQFLPDNNFNGVYGLFKRLRKVKKKKRMDIHGYYDIASKIILLFNSRAPFILYSGNSPEDATELIESIEEKYEGLSLVDIETEIFNRKASRPRKLSIAFLVLSIVFLGSSVFFCYKYIETRNECAALQQSLLVSKEAISTLSAQYMESIDENAALMDEVSFWNENLVLITESGSKYHKYGCSYAKNCTKILSIEKAEARGYSACTYCAPRKHATGTLTVIGDDAEITMEDFARKWLNNG